MRDNIPQIIVEYFKDQDLEISELLKYSTLKDFVNAQVDKHIQEEFDGDKDRFIQKTDWEGIGYYLTSYTSIPGINECNIQLWDGWE